jgi:hypothetical protein
MNTVIADAAKELRGHLVARCHDARMRELEANNIASWVEQAEIAILVRDNREWEVLGFKGFDAWLEDCVPQSRAQVYGYMKLYTDLRPTLDVQDLKAMKPGSAKIVRKLPAKMQKQMAEKAKAMPPQKLVEEIQRTNPELHLERLVATKYHFEVSQQKVVNAAIDLACMVEGEELSAEVALEKICASYLLLHQQEFEELREEDPLPF